MIILTTEQVQTISGGKEVLVTDEWKYNEAHKSGIFGGILMGLFSAALPIIHEIPCVLLIWACGLAGGGIGYGAFYSWKQLDNSHFKNNTWYII